MLGRTVSHYRILSHIGSGGMGTVYLAEDTKLQRRVALKFLPPSTPSAPDASARLVHEARAASALDHPHIGTIYEIGEVDGQPFIAMAYYDGETLAVRLTRGALPTADAARVVAEIADALAAAHAVGIVHRDLKPSNLMLSSSGHVKVLDFGISMFSSSDTETRTRLTAAGTTVGTAAYMSPEQAAGGDVDSRSDLWSLGVVLREMLTGRPTFEGTNSLAVIHAVLTATPPPIRSLRPDVAPELDEIVARTMVRDRNERTITAGEVRELAAACLARLSSGGLPTVGNRARRRAPTIAIGIAVLALASAAAWWAHRNAKVRWAREEALPAINRLAGADKFDDAYRLALQAESYIPNDPLLAEQFRVISRRAVIESAPSGAQVFYRPYGQTGEQWRSLGTTPIKNVRVPRGLLHWKAELAGFDVAEDVGPGPFWPPRFIFKLVPARTGPAGMVRISSSDQPFRLFIPGLDHLPAVKLQDYWIDQHEVTNREFKRFMDDGGYRRSDLWQEPFVKDGRPIGFDEAMALLIDTTGRRGPATWEQGVYPNGQDDYPVTGVSWYEAAAFARWAGKSLPTIFHWSRAADQRLSGDVVPASNFGGKGPLPAGRNGGGITRAGTIDMAGNVKEWCWNNAGAKRYILGGAWNEPAYMFTDADAQSPLARSPTFGFRCIRTDRAEDLSAGVAGGVAFPSRDLRTIPPVSDAVFRAWKSVYSFDHDNLNATVDAVDDSSPEWRMEKVSYAAAYANERIPAYLFLPKHSSEPYQTIVYFPGSGVINRRSNPNAVDIDFVNFIMRSGRALLYPIYKSTHERSDAITSDYPNTTALWRDHIVMWSKDLGRSVDYLHTRPDIDKGRIGYMGYSWGAALAPLLLALETRLSLALLNVGGFYQQAALPEADPVNFASRVTIPVLMLNGRFDFFFPTDTSQEPMFRQFGTPGEHKRRVVYESGHAIPRTELIKEFVGWMDKYWGAASEKR